MTAEASDVPGSGETSLTQLAWFLLQSCRWSRLAVDSILSFGLEKYFRPTADGEQGSEGQSVAELAGGRAVCVLGTIFDDETREP